MNVTLALFGAFRDLHSAPALQLNVDGSTIADLRQALIARLQDEGRGDRCSLVSVSAFASEQSILRDGDSIPGDGQLAILPPVSGG